MTFKKKLSFQITKNEKSSLQEMISIKKNILKFKQLEIVS